MIQTFRCIFFALCLFLGFFFFLMPMIDSLISGVMLLFKFGGGGCSGFGGSVCWVRLFV